MDEPALDTEARFRNTASGNKGVNIRQDNSYWREIREHHDVESSGGAVPGLCPGHQGSGGEAQLRMTCLSIINVSRTCLRKLMTMFQSFIPMLMERCFRTSSRSAVGRRNSTRPSTSKKEKPIELSKQHHAMTYSLPAALI